MKHNYDKNKFKQQKEKRKTREPGWIALIVISYKISD